MSASIVQIVLSLGYIGLGAIIFAESGIFFAFFLPGDSVLFSAGLLASQGIFSIWILVPLFWIAAVLGNSTGYWFGAKVGEALFTRDDSLFFKKRYVEETHRFYGTYGAATIVLARFIPGVRTFAPILAGVGHMRYLAFLRYNILGSILWSFGITLAGYFLGRTIPGVDQYLLPIIALIIFLSILPIVLRSWHRK